MRSTSVVMRSAATRLRMSVATGPWRVIRSMMLSSVAVLELVDRPCRR